MQLILTSKRPLGGNAWAFYFRPERPLSWIAGQAIRFRLPHHQPDNGGTDRYFTICAAPHERELTIATRLSSSSFKQALSQLPQGGSAELTELPTGTFVWADTTGPIVLAAQGIGITPFYAILKDRLHRGLPVPVRLIYANFSGSAPFASELSAWAARTPEFKLHYVAEAVTAALLGRLEPALAHATVYSSGPASLIQLMLPPINLPARQLKRDVFTGYAANSY